MGWFTKTNTDTKETLYEAMQDSLSDLLSKLAMLDGDSDISGPNTADAIARSIIVPQLANVRWGVFRDGQREKGWLHKKLNYDISKKITGYDFWASFYNNLLQYHNAYAEITRNNKGSLVSAIILPSNEVFTNYTGPVEYRHKGRTISKADIWHVKLNSFDGYRGKAFKDQLAIYDIYNRTEALAKKYMQHGGNPKRIWKLVGELDSAQLAKLKETLRQIFENSTKDEILPSIVENVTEQISNKDGQLLEQRKYNRDEILWLHGIDPGNVDLKTIYRVVMSPILENVSQSISKYLLSPSERVKYDIKPVGTSRFMGDLETLVELAGKLKAQELASTNELRKTLLSELGLGEIEGGDTLQNPYTGSEKERNK